MNEIGNKLLIIKNDKYNSLKNEVFKRINE